MDQPSPKRDPLEGLQFTFESDAALNEPISVDFESAPRQRGGRWWDWLWTKGQVGRQPFEAHTDDGFWRDAGDVDDDDDIDDDRELYRESFGETPMTDPRSFGSSVLLHVLLIAIASLTAINVAISPAADGPKTLQGDLDRVDNRADANKSSGSGGGGSPGEIGGLGEIAFVAPADGTNPKGAGLEAAADALLNEILPNTASKPPEVTDRALPGPQTTGMGLVPGTGAGGGGGSGGGSGGGVGRGVGPGTEFFGARETGRSFAYVIDCSGSMATRNSLEVAKRELLSSLNQLPPDVRFSIIFYNLRIKVMTDPNGKGGMMPATAGNKVRVRNQLQTVKPDGGTDHMLALREALNLKPEVIFFLTDADLMSNNDVNEILGIAAGSRIQAVEFGRGSDLGTQTPLRRLATTTGGTYRYIDVTTFPRNAQGY